MKDLGALCSSHLFGLQRLIWGRPYTYQGLRISRGGRLKQTGFIPTPAKFLILANYFTLQSSSFSALSMPCGGRFFTQQDVLYEQKESSNYVYKSDSSALLPGSWSTRQSSFFLPFVSHTGESAYLSRLCAFDYYLYRLVILLWPNTCCGVNIDYGASWGIQCQQSFCSHHSRLFLTFTIIIPIINLINRIDTTIISSPTCASSMLVIIVASINHNNTLSLSVVLAQPDTLLQLVSPFSSLSISCGRKRLPIEVYAFNLADPMRGRVLLSIMCLVLHLPSCEEYLKRKNVHLFWPIVLPQPTA